MNPPTEADIGKPVVHKQSKSIRQIARRNGEYGVWTKYRGFHGRINWENWVELDRLPVDGDNTYTAIGGAGGVT